MKKVIIAITMAVSISIIIISCQFETTLTKYRKCLSHCDDEANSLYLACPIVDLGFSSTVEFGYCTLMVEYYRQDCMDDCK